MFGRNGAGVWLPSSRLVQTFEPALNQRSDSVTARLTLRRGGRIARIGARQAHDLAVKATRSLSESRQ